MQPRPAVEASDEELVRRIQRGERARFATLFERHYGRLARFVRHLGVPGQDLEDVLAEVFIRALAHIQAFRVDGGTRYVSYLYTIARHLVTDRARQESRAPRVEPLSEPECEPDPAGDLSPVDVILHRERVALIRSALERLRPSDREIILLSYDDELSCREIMHILGKPSISAVTTHLYKAMQKLRAAVRARDPDESPASPCEVSYE
ncbi:MAG: RNA polymerase sigma factor [Armatimonadetes bacterium]|nr:RNA polymerase sigma factor [Armatimonadota bacterium]